MTTTHHRIIEKVFQTAAIFAISFLFFFQQTAFAQVSASRQSGIAAASKPPVLKAHIFAAAQPLVLKVLFANPEKEDIMLIVKKDGKETVYTKKLGTIEAYNSRIDVSALPDGNYSVEVIGERSRFSETFEISTQIARLTSVY